MKQITIDHSASQPTLTLVTGTKPTPSDHEVLIKVSAAGINRPDILQKQGLYPPPPGAPDILGLEVAGYVVATGAMVTRWHVGDSVCALLTGGGYAEYATAHEHLCLPIPAGFNHVQAAALPETLFTVWRNLFYPQKLQPNDSLLIHGGSSGIGTMAIQLAKCFQQFVITTVGSDKKCQFCRDLGADLAINYHEQDFVTEVKTATSGKGANCILDMVGGDYIQKNLSAAAFRGRIISIAFLNGAKQTVNMMPMMLKELTLTGATLRSRPIEEKAQLATELEREVWPLLERGKIAPIIDSTFPLHLADRAHQLMESREHLGKVVLTVAH